MSKRTIKRHLPKNRPRGDYEVRCDLCGVPWYRSEMRKDRAGRLRCPDDRHGRDPVTLSELNAAAAQEAAMRPHRARDGGGYDSDSYRAPDEVFGDLLEVWWDFNDASTIVESSGVLTSVADKSGNGRTGTPAGTISYFSSGGPADRGYVSNVTAVSNSFVSASGLAVEEGSRIALLGVFAFNSTYRTGIATCLQLRPSSGTVATSGWDDTSGFRGSSGVSGTTISMPGRLLPGEWRSLQYYAAEASLLTVDDGVTFVSETDHSLPSNFGSDSAFAAAIRRSNITTAILLNGEPTAAQRAEYTNWVMKEHGFRYASAEASGRLAIL